MQTTYQSSGSSSSSPAPSMVGLMGLSFAVVDVFLDSECELFAPIMKLWCFLLLLSLYLFFSLRGKGRRGRLLIV